MLIDRQDILFAIRSARRTPLLTAVAIVALSVGIGLNAGIFAILNALFLEPPTRQDPASFVQIYPRYEGWFTGAAQNSSFNADDYEAIRSHARSLADAAAWQRITVRLDELRGENSAALATCNYFQVFGTGRPLLGRLFLAGDCKAGTEVRIAVLSEHLWRDAYSSDKAIVGKVIHVNRQALTVVGVARDDDSANPIVGNLWMPYTLQPAFNHGNNAFQNPAWPWLSVAGRLRPGFSRADAKAELVTILRQRDRFYLEQKAFTQDRKTSLVVTDGSYINNPVFASIVVSFMALILGPLALVLLLACTNVTMLFLSRSLARRGEMAVRLALGAGRARLMRMLALESLLTAAIAGVIGVLLSTQVTSLLFRYIDPEEGRPMAAMVHTDWKVFGYLAALVVVAAIASALAPMRESFKLDLVTAIKGREGTATSRARTTAVLTVMQIAMSFVLLAAAVLFARLPGTITGSDPGFETHQTMRVPLDIEFPPYTQASAQAFFRSLEARILAAPGAQSLADQSLDPFRPAPVSEIRLDGQNAGQGSPAAINDVSSDYFSTLNIQILHGRAFAHSDVTATSRAPVTVVSAAFAKSFWGANDPLGKAVVTPDGRRLTVVGIARDLRSEHFGVLDGPRIYTLRDPQALPGELLVRFSGRPAPVSAAIAEVVKSLDSTQVGTPSTLWDYLETNATAMTGLARIIVFMAGVAVLLAITGVYAVLTFAIKRRTREFGIQMMLGATRQLIFRSVMTRGVRQIAIGLICGAALAMPSAWAFQRLTTRSPFRVNFLDPSLYGISALILLAVALAAMLLPALRATQVDPIETLRNE